MLSEQEKSRLRVCWRAWSNAAKLTELPEMQATYLMETSIAILKNISELPNA